MHCIAMLMHLNYGELKVENDVEHLHSGSNIFKEQSGGAFILVVSLYPDFAVSKGVWLC